MSSCGAATSVPAISGRLSAVIVSVPVGRIGSAVASGAVVVGSVAAGSTAGVVVMDS